MKYRTKYEAPWADPAEGLIIINTGEWRYQRPAINASKCCQCGTCYLFCPTNSIMERGTHFAADLTYCKGCGICSSVCPVYAIVMVREEKG